MPTAGWAKLRDSFRSPFPATGQAAQLHRAPRFLRFCVGGVHTRCFVPYIYPTYCIAGTATFGRSYAVSSHKIVPGSPSSSFGSIEACHPECKVTHGTESRCSFPAADGYQYQSLLREVTEGEQPSIYLQGPGLPTPRTLLAIPCVPQRQRKSPHGTVQSSSRAITQSPGKSSRKARLWLR